jgi:hypothetical protein
MRDKLEIYLPEKPKQCLDCIFCEKYRYNRRYCSLIGVDLGCFDKDKECPIKSIKEYKLEEENNE